MKKIIISFFALISFSAIAQQTFAGFRNGYYSGTHSILSNPANIAGSPRKWDVNLVSLDANIVTDRILIDFNLEESIHKFSDLANFRDLDFSGNLHLDALGPSAMVRINEKHSVGLTTRARLFANIDNFNAKLIEAIFFDTNNIKSLPYTLKVENQGIMINAFSEIGATWAGTVFQSDKHTIKVGATAKFLQGIANTHFYINDLQATIDADVNKKEVYLDNASGSLSFVNSGVDIIESFQADDITKSHATGLGLDLGVVYEYRLDPSDEKYTLKAALAVTDIGALKYTPLQNRAYHYSIVNASRIIISDDIQKNLNNTANVTSTDVTGKYNSSLPTALQSSIDYRIWNNFYAEISGIVGLSKNKNKPENSYYINEFVVTPRFENKYFGGYLPVSYNQLSQFNAGVAVRLGPLVVGSSSLLSHLGNSKQMDFFFGIRFGN